MSQVTQIQKNSNVLSCKSSQILASAVLGFVILLVVGFSPLNVIHNATHDVRHSTGFPCH